MGYYSEANFNVQIKKEKIAEFQKAVAELKADKIKKPDDINLDFTDYFFADDFNIDENGYFEYNDFYNKWYDSELFAVFIRDFVTDGRITFYGEDGEKWGYYFDGNGNAHNLNFVEARGELIC